MKTHIFSRTKFSRRQTGAAIVEFALVMSIFFFLILLIMEFGRLLFTWNSAVEATRRAARLAIVCDPQDPNIMTQLQSILPSQMVASAVYSPNNCIASSNCKAVTVYITASSPAMQYYYPLTMGVISLASNTWQIPAFSTTVTTESLSRGSGSGPGSNSNPDCSP